MEFSFFFFFSFRQLCFGVSPLASAALFSPWCGCVVRTCGSFLSSHVSRGHSDLIGSAQALWPPSEVRLRTYWHWMLQAWRPQQHPDFLCGLAYGLDAGTLPAGSFPSCLLSVDQLQPRKLRSPVCLPGDATTPSLTRLRVNQVELSPGRVCPCYGQNWYFSPLDISSFFLNF